MHVAVLYNIAEHTPNGHRAESGATIDATADQEILETAAAVQTALVQNGHRAEQVRLDPENMDALAHYDWIFNLVESIHGFPYTEYEITRRMEARSYGFTGAGTLGLSSCIDKAYAKQRMLEAGILTPAFCTISPGQPIQVDLPFPLFAKPVHEDASIGISHTSIIHTQAGLEAKVAEIHSLFHQPALVEEYIDGRDVMASVLGNGTATTILPFSEVTYLNSHTGPKVLTYETKWLSLSNSYQNSETRCPTDLDAESAARIASATRSVFRLLGCQDYARVDFRLRGQTPYVLEVNPNPCINPDDSGFLASARAAGLDFNAVVEMILEHSLQRKSISVSASHEEAYP